MLKSTAKKVLAFIVVSTIMLSTFSAMAATTWEFVGYDVSDTAVENGSYAKIYYEVDEKGIPTNVTKREGHASKIEWKHDDYEFDFPHKEYERLYLDGIGTERVRYTGAVAPWEKRFAPYVWEITYPYNIWQELQTNIPQYGWVKTNFVEDSGDNANVIERYPVFGFDKYRFYNQDRNSVVNYSDFINIAIPHRIQGLNSRVSLVDYSLKDYISNVIMPKYGVSINGYSYDGYAFNLDDAYNTYAELAYSYNGSFVSGESEFNEDLNKLFSFIQRTDSLTLEGPVYDNAGNETGKVTKNAVDEIYFNHMESGLIHPKNPIIVADDHTFTQDKYADIEWVSMGYELQEPYRYYEVLSVDGILMDGTNVLNTRYTRDLPRLEQPEIVREVETELNIPHSKYLDSYNVPFDDKPPYLTIAGLTAHNTYKDFVGGSDRENWVVTRLPYIYRYTGGLANPKVEWIPAWPENEYPHRVVEQKFVDGIATDVYRATGEFAGRLPIIEITDVGRELKINLISSSLDPVKLVGELNRDYIWYTVDNERSPRGADNNEIWVDKLVNRDLQRDPDTGLLYRDAPTNENEGLLNKAMYETNHDYQNIISDILSATRKNITDHN